ncbi:unnamed protein product [Auanema sp. JU1783]|nr:unnamed protein product [Auanema sp. JU1783]
MQNALGRSKESNSSKNASGKLTHGERFLPEKKRDSKTEQKIKESLKGDGKFDLSNNVYSSSGYSQRLADLGEDPLSSVRTLRSYLKKRSVEWNLEDRPVAETLCRSACEQLDEAEGHLMKLHGKRSEAILIGEVALAEQIKTEMEKYKEEVIRSTLSDLVIDSAEMKAFGVDSAWTPDQSYCPPPSNIATPAKRDSKQKSVKGPPYLQRSERFKPRTAVLPKNTEQFRNSDDSPPDMSGKNYDQHEVRRNDRLSDLMSNTTFFNEPRIDNPYDIPRESIRPSAPIYPSYTPNTNLYGYDSSSSLMSSKPSANGSCSYCGYTGFHLMSPEGLRDHHKRECKIMNLCRFCQKIVLVPQLTDHLINRCSFLQDRMTRCIKCNLSADKIDQDLGLKHPLCRGTPPPNGAVWCPLCAIAVTDNPESWREHLTSKCYVNPRKNGPENIPERSDLENSRNQQTNLNGRFIDADKLVAALQVTNPRDE